MIFLHRRHVFGYCILVFYLLFVTTNFDLQIVCGSRAVSPVLRCWKSKLSSLGFMMSIATSLAAGRITLGRRLCGGGTAPIEKVYRVCQIYLQ